MFFTPVAQEINLFLAQGGYFCTTCAKNPFSSPLPPRCAEGRFDARKNLMREPRSWIPGGDTPVSNSRQAIPRVSLSEPAAAPEGYSGGGAKKDSEVQRTCGAFTRRLGALVGAGARWRDHSRGVASGTGGRIKSSKGKTGTGGGRKKGKQAVPVRPFLKNLPPGSFRERAGRKTSLDGKGAGRQGESLHRGERSAGLRGLSRTGERLHRRRSVPFA